MIRLAAAFAVLAAEVAACPLPAPPAAPAAERVLRLDTPDGALAATLAGPADAAPLARVVLLHGYTGARDEIPTAAGEGMFARAARAFAEARIATLRIDFLGSGRSEGDWADTTFAGQARDARRALEHLARLLPGELPDALLGYSQGGLVALRAGGADRLALWNPVLDPKDVYGRLLGPEALAEGVRRDAAGDERIVGDTRLRPAFFADLAGADPLADAARFPGPLLVVAGTRDSIARNGPEGARVAAGRRDAPTEILVVEAGHDLGAVSDLARFDAVLACTAAFLLGL